LTNSPRAKRMIKLEINEVSRLKRSRRRYRHHVR
jgi:hypothetical protein